MKQKLLFNQFGYRVLTTWYFFIHLKTILQIVKKVIKKISMNFLAKYFLFYFYFCWWCKKKLYTFPSIIITCFWIFLSIYFLWCQLLHSYCSSLSLIKYLKQKNNKFEILKKEKPTTCLMLKETLSNNNQMKRKITSIN